MHPTHVYPIPAAPPHPLTPAQMYRDGGPGVLRPIAIRLGGYPTPGICMGLQNALIGMRVGGRRTVVVPPGLGFGSTPALAPYAAVPANSIVRYEIQLLRLSRKGPDALVKVSEQGGVSRDWGAFNLHLTMWEIDHMRFVRRFELSVECEATGGAYHLC